MQNVVVSQLVRRKIRDIFSILLEEDYFSLEENARSYTNALLDFTLSIPTQKHRLTYNKRWGSHYATYKANRRTSWHITFDKETNDAGELYIVRNIFNNHTKGFPYFITGSK